MNPFKYYLCRNDKNTKQRHIEVAHKKDSTGVHFATIDQFEAKEALRLYEIACRKRLAKNADTPDIDVLSATGSSDLSSNGNSESETFISDNAENPSEDDSGEPVSKCQIIENKQDDEASKSRIEVKLDTVIGMLENLSTKAGETKQSFPQLSVVVKQLSQEKDMHLEWNSFENIIDLTEKVKTIRFFASEDNTKGCVRCQTCFEYLCTRDGRLNQTSHDGHATDDHIRK
jgi:hypothetical protein